MMIFGLKVHHRDLAYLLDMHPDALEFALFFDDLGGAWIDRVEFDGPIVLHMPEKFEDGSLIDLASPDGRRRGEAVGILKKTIDLAERMHARSVICHPGGVRRAPTPVDRAPLLASLGELLAYAPDSVALLLENMPDIYWYNGVLHSSCLFKRKDEIADTLKTLGMGLCLDLCHAKLYCNAAGEDFLSYVKALKPLIGHIHVSDARGVADEGVQIGEGDIDFKALLPLLADLDVIAVPEILDGHRNAGAGFATAVDRLRSIGFFR